jgi:predicted nuclease of restriction endonuclease-like (RecB) superfamily
MANESNPHGKTRILSSTETELLQDRLNTFLLELPENTAIVDLKYGMQAHGNSMIYSVLVHYKFLDTAEW